MRAQIPTTLLVITVSASPAALAAGSSSAPPAAVSQVAARARDADGLRAVFHLSDPGRAPTQRGLENARNALQALGDRPARFVLVVHGQALNWFRRAEPDNLVSLTTALLATGKVELRVCTRSLAENRWRLEDLVAGATATPSGTLEVLRLQQDGYSYFKP